MEKIALQLKEIAREANRNARRKFKADIENLKTVDDVIKNLSERSVNQ